MAANVFEKMGFSDAEERRAESARIDADVVILKNRSAFISKMAGTAKSIDKDFKSDDKENFSNENNWRIAWLTPDIYKDPPNGNTVIDTPAALLKILPKETRKEYLILYLRERFPGKAVITDPDFSAIGAATPDALANPALQKSIKSFMELGKEMENQEGDTTGTAFGRVKPAKEELKDAAKEGLEDMYFDNAVPPALKGKAFDDFSFSLRSNPSVGLGTSIDPIAMKLALAGEKTSFAAALQHGIFTSAHLKEMSDKYQAKKNDQDRVIRDATIGQQRVKGKIEEHENKSFTERSLENFGKLNGFQQLATVGIGGWYLWRTLFRNDKTRFEKFIVTPFVGISAFYLLGGRDMLRGTTLDPAIKNVEGHANRLLRKARGTPDDEPLTRANTEMYARYFSEVAGKKVGPEIEAMGYIANVPMADIAASLTINDGARTGRLDLSPNSALSKKIDKLYSDSGLASIVKSRIAANSDKLANSMIPIFYMIGSLKKPAEHRQVEDARSGKSYDDLADGSPVRKMYERLAKDGLSVADIEYKKINWYVAVEKLLNLNKQATL